MASKFAAYGNKFEEVRKRAEQKKVAAEKGGEGYDDSWKFRPQLPANKPKITYRLRLLPNVHSELGEPWLLAHFHMFRRPDGKFIYTLCPTSTEGKDAKCPFCEKSKRLFDTQDKSLEDEARKVYKKKRFFANVLVVDDPRQGEENQEGQVLVWEFGTQIYDKLEEQIERGMNFYDVFEGRDFELQIKKKGEYPDYNSSQFAMDASPVSDSEEKLDAIFEQIHNLDEKIIGKGPRPYEKLVEMLTGEAPTRDKLTDSSATEETEDDVDSTFDDDVTETKEPKKEKAKPVESNDDDDSFDDDDFDFGDDD